MAGLSSDGVLNGHSVVVNAALRARKLLEQQERTAMAYASNSEVAPVGPSQSERLAILAFGVPSLIIWALAVRYSLPVLLHIVGQTPSGMGSANGGRVLYIVLVGIIALCGATLSAGMLRRAWKGKAPVWSAAITLCVAVLGLLLVGLIGD